MALSVVAVVAAGAGTACSSSDDSTTGNPATGNDGGTGSDSSTTTTPDGSGGTSTDSGTQSTGETGTTPPAAGLVIDDMSNPSSAQIKLSGFPAGQQAGFWFSFSDVQTNTFVPPLNSPFTYTTVTPPTGVTSTHAACLTSGGWVGYAAGEGFNFTVTSNGPDAAADAGTTPLTFDISTYTGVSYWIMSTADAGTSGIKVSLPDDNTHGADTTSTCKKNLAAGQAGQCDDDWSIQNEVISGTWQQYTHAWADFTQSSSAYGGLAGTFTSLDEPHVFGINFQVSDPSPLGPADAGTNPPAGFCVADIQFTK